MKRVLIALVALALVVGLCILTLWKLNATHDRLTAELQKLEVVYIQHGIKACVKPAEAFCREVEAQTSWMVLFFHQNILNEIVESGQLAAVYAAEESGENFRAQLTRCRHALNEIYTLEFPAWGSIF